MIIDGATVITGSFNFTKAAEEHNAENMLVIRDAALAEQYASDRRHNAISHDKDRQCHRHQARPETGQQRHHHDRRVERDIRGQAGAKPRLQSQPQRESRRHCHDRHTVAQHPLQGLLPPIFRHEPVFLQGFVHGRQRKRPRACFPRRH
jgi:hypothetical protein